MRTCSFDYYGLCLSRGCFASKEKCHSMHWSEAGKSLYPTYAEGTLQVANHIREKYESQQQEIQQKDEALRLARIALKDYCSITIEFALEKIDQALGGTKDEQPTS